jgi:hypothetical protein
MTKTLVLAGLGLLSLTLGGCAAVRSPVSGSLYLDVKSSESVGTGVVSPKMGSAQATTILGWVGTGDASISTAAKAAGITKVSYVDYHSTNILGLFGTTTTIVYGE